MFENRWRQDNAECDRGAHTGSSVSPRLTRLIFYVLTYPGRCAGRMIGSVGAWTQAADPRVPSILVPRRRAHLRASQRERLLAAMAELAGRDGYGGVTVAQVIARAGVSRATFYECFGDREECLLAALGPIHERLLGEVCEAASGAPAGHVAAAVVRALSAFAASHPTQARLALSESLGARDRALQARDRLVAAIAAVIDEAYEAAPAATRAADLPSAVLVGGVCRVLGARVSRAEPLERGLADELTAWLGCYELPLARHRWRELRPLWAPARSPFLPPGRLRAPRRGAAGRRRLHDGRVGRGPAPADRVRDGGAGQAPRAMRRRRWRRSHPRRAWTRACSTATSRASARRWARLASCCSAI